MGIPVVPRSGLPSLDPPLFSVVFMGLVVSVTLGGCFHRQGVVFIVRACSCSAGVFLSRRLLGVRVRMRSCFLCPHRTVSMCVRITMYPRLGLVFGRVCYCVFAGVHGFGCERDFGRLFS